MRLHCKVLPNGKLQIPRLIDGYYMTVSAFNFNTRTLQVGGSPMDWTQLVNLVGEETAYECLQYIKNDILMQFNQEVTK